MYSTGDTTALITASIDDTTVTYGDLLTIQYVAFTANSSTEIIRRIYSVDPNTQVRTELYKVNDGSVVNNTLKPWYINTAEVDFPEEGTLQIIVSTDPDNNVIPYVEKVFTVTVAGLEGANAVSLHEDDLIAYIASKGYANNESNSTKLDVEFRDINHKLTTIETDMVNFNYTSNGFM